MKKVLIQIGLILALCTNDSKANSYLDMITSKPVGQTEEELPSAPAVDEVLETPLSSVVIKNTPTMRTTSPVVTSPYPKYQAWLKAKARENRYDNTHEQIQNMIYTLEGGLLGLGIYEIYRYK